MGHGGDRTNHAEGRVFDDCQAVVAAKNLAAHELDAWRPLAERFEFFDLVLETTDFGLFHFHRAQFDRLLDRNAANVVDDPLALFDRPFAERLEGVGGRGHRFVDAVEDAKTTGIAAAIHGRAGGGSHAREHLLDDAANQFFGGLHRF